MCIRDRHYTSFLNYTHSYRREPQAWLVDFLHHCLRLPVGCNNPIMHMNIGIFILKVNQIQLPHISTRAVNAVVIMGSAMYTEISILLQLRLSAPQCTLPSNPNSHSIQQTKINIMKTSITKYSKNLISYYLLLYLPSLRLSNN